MTAETNPLSDITDRVADLRYEITHASRLEEGAWTVRLSAKRRRSHHTWGTGATFGAAVANALAAAERA